MNEVNNKKDLTLNTTQKILGNICQLLNPSEVFSCTQNQQKASVKIFKVKEVPGGSLNKLWLEDIFVNLMVSKELEKNKECIFFVKIKDFIM